MLTWIQTILGAGALATLMAVALFLLGLDFSLAACILGLAVLFPLLGWYFSASIARRLTLCQSPEATNPDHVRLIGIVNRLLGKTDLKVAPPVYVSPLLIPNAIATGRTPGQSFIAVTEGLLALNLSDDELEAVLAHELAHVRNYDVAILSCLAATASLFSLILATAFPRLFNLAFISQRAPLMERLSRRVKGDKKLLLPGAGIITFLSTLLVFYLVSCLVRMILLFVTRARESAADAQAAYWTGNPCALSTALQKIVNHMQRHDIDMRHFIIIAGLTPVFFASPLLPIDDESQKADGFFFRLRRWWRRLGDRHPPVKKRIETLDRLAGGICPRL